MYLNKKEGYLQTNFKLYRYHLNIIYIYININVDVLCPSK